MSDVVLILEGIWHIHLIVDSVGKSGVKEETSAFRAEIRCIQHSRTMSDERIIYEGRGHGNIEIQPEWHICFL